MIDEADNLKTKNYNSTSSNPAENVYDNIDPISQLFPYCIVWTPLPLISWFIPFIGHTGICSYEILLIIEVMVQYTILQVQKLLE